jgi:hypothetical protein
MYRNFDNASLMTLSPSRRHHSGDFLRGDVMAVTLSAI